MTGTMRQVTANAPDAALHHHTASDAVPGTMTLCATAPEDDAVRWTHLTVNASQWQGFSQLREWARDRVRHQLGDDQAPIRLLVLDDAGLFSEAADSDGPGQDGAVSG